MSDIHELYQELIIDHNRSPRNFHMLPDASRRADGYNPLCGDQLTLYVRVEDGVIQDISFQGTGCAISKASASLMTESVKARTITEANMLFDQFHRMVTGEGQGLPDPERLGKLLAFSGVSEFPVRVKCATLAWHTLRAAIEAKQGTVSTE